MIAKKKNKAQSPTPPQTIGWREWAAFPDLGVKRIKAKIDTGAKTSALHAFKIRETRDGGRSVVNFAIHPFQGKARPEILCAADVKCRRRIKSSNGAVEERIVIRAKLKLGRKIYPIDLSLTNRDAMGFRLLLGRDALKRFVIAPQGSYRLGVPKRRPKR